VGLARLSGVGAVTAIEGDERKVHLTYPCTCPRRPHALPSLLITLLIVRGRRESFVQGGRAAREEFAGSGSGCSWCSGSEPTGSRNRREESALGFEYCGVMNSLQTF
jgi:hypothetical protein